MVKKDIFIFIQARETSSRLPRKVFKKIGNKSVIEIILDRLKKTMISKDNFIFLIPGNKKIDH